MEEAMRRVVVCLCVFCLLPVYCLAGPLYKWVDDKGVVHYSDRRPASSDSVRDFEDRSYPDPKASTVPRGAMVKSVAADEQETVEAAEPEVDVEMDADVEADETEMAADDEMSEEDNAMDEQTEGSSEDVEMDNEGR
ncbi:MAG: hypothetical protein C0620_04580 [Desulfuromonas sp.]|jgi:hypothetical protein|nr:MAG: hypothetical protein C0620_04580 [Desulfuromonas sp.]